MEERGLGGCRAWGAAGALSGRRLKMMRQRTLVDKCWNLKVI